MCLLSALNGCWPLPSLLPIAQRVSKIGTPKIRIGTIMATTRVVFKTPMVAAVARTKPKSSEPESPRNILAGEKLYLKKASEAEARANNNIAAPIWWVLKATKNKVIEEIAVTPVAKPSSPSIKFIALVTPTTQIKVRGIAKLPIAMIPLNGLLKKLISTPK